MKIWNDMAAGLLTLSVTSLLASPFATAQEDEPTSENESALTKVLGGMGSLMSPQGGGEDEEPIEQGDVLLEPSPDADMAEDKEAASEDAPLMEPEIAEITDVAPDGIDCGGEGVCIVEATSQPLRALPRSFAALYSEPDATEENILSNAVSAFKPTFVFDRENVDLTDPTEPKGWYQIGYSTRSPIGWLQAKDVVEWRQALLLEYMHPGTAQDARTPVLMFESSDQLKSVVMASDRSARADNMLSEIRAGGVPEGVVGKEPSNFLNINDSFYLLPVVQWSREQALDEPSHYLQVFAAVPGERAEFQGEGTLEDEDYLQEDILGGSRAEMVDIVFVMDMTGSMQPYINSVKNALSKVVSQIEASEQDEKRVRFGLIGYRDNIDVTPELEWNVKNFTPELVDAQSILDLIEGEAKAAQVSSDEWAEDVHGGYLEGLNSAWRENEGNKSVRIMLLIGDASGHNQADERRGFKNSASMTEADLNAQARDVGVYPFAIYLQDGRAERDWDQGLSQFGAFARGGKGNDDAVLPAPTDEADAALDQAANYIGSRMSELISSELGEIQKFVDSAEDEQAPAPANETAALMIEMAQGVMQAAMVDYLGDGAKAPKDFVSWVHDYDLKDPNRPALAARVLITREQFDNIIRQTEALNEALDNNILGQIDFLTSLQLASAKTSLGLEVDPDLSLGEQEFLPKWVAALPYRSRVLSITPSEFANLTASERAEFQASLKSKHNSYLEIASATEKWFKLDENDTELQEVVALRLSLLP